MHRRGFLGLLAAVVGVRLQPHASSLIGMDGAAQPSRQLYLYCRPGLSAPKSSCDLVGSWTELTPDEVRALFEPLEPLDDVEAD